MWCWFNLNQTIAYNLVVDAKTKNKNIYFMAITLNLSATKHNFEFYYGMVL